MCSLLALALQCLKVGSALRKLLAKAFDARFGFLLFCGDQLAPRGFLIVVDCALERGERGGNLAL
jgi:hypothetical protein